MYVVDRAGNLVAPGCAGELLIAGIGVGRGYLGDPAKTAQSFVADPFSPVPGGRVYRSGDLVRHRPDGVLEFLGRIDHQVKIRGFRIELGDIEETLRSHAAVRDAAVVCQSHAGEARLVAYVATGDALDADGSALRAHLKALLPEYMVPAAIVCLAELPLTPSGKVDRKALPAVDAAGLSGARPYTAPRTPLEHSIVQIWQAVLEVPRIGIDDDFFELGGHSLLATRVAARLRAAVRVDFPLRKLFEFPTVRDLAHELLELQIASASPEDLDQVLAQVDGMTDEEVAEVLARLADKVTST
jgi:acyl carrier protein